MSMMKILKVVKDYYFYCGIGKEEYKVVKKDAYISNYKVWKILHFLMAIIFGALFIVSLFNNIMIVNRWFYLGAFIYSLPTTVSPRFPLSPKDLDKPLNSSMISKGYVVKQSNI